VYARESAKVCESEWSILPPAFSINLKGRAQRGELSFCFYISYYDIYCILHARDAALMPINSQLPHTVVAVLVSRDARPQTSPHAPACVRTNRVALCKERAPGALHVRQGQHKGLRIK
jgi:hypothetical protein